MAKPKTDLFCTEYERQTAGAAILDSGVTLLCAATQPEHFHDRLLGAIWRGAREMQQAGEFVDPVTLADWLQSHGVSVTAGFLLGLANEVVSVAHAEAYASKVTYLNHRRVSESLGQNWVRAVYQSNGSYFDDLSEIAQQMTAHVARLRPEPVDVEPASWLDMAESIGPVTWEWDRWLPAGLLTMLVAQSGSGKSLLALRIAATYLRGLPWPDGVEYRGTLGRVLWCESEAAQAVNLERARAWGLPLEALVSPLANPLDDVNLFDAAHRAAIAARAGRPDVRLIVVDSLSGASGGRERGEDQMPVVKFLAELARDTGKPLLLLHHLRKKGMFDGSGDAVTLDMVRGTTVIVQPARVVWALDAPDTNQPDHRRLSVIKSNLGRFPDALGLRVEDAGLSFDAVAPSAPRPDSPVNRAVDLLRSLLASGPMPARQIEEEAAGAGISMNSMKQAKEILNILAIRKGGRYDAHWLWSLPAVQALEQA